MTGHIYLDDVSKLESLVSLQLGNIMDPINEFFFLRISNVSFLGHTSYTRYILKVTVIKTRKKVYYLCWI